MSSQSCVWKVEGASFLDILLRRMAEMTQDITGDKVCMCVLVCKSYGLFLSPLKKVSVVQRSG